ncbi:response regulator transcription factor [Cereibacter sphaeroides]|uniref:response regulator transcription factor n=1 Tax=Cereibacter sphaeroides TaxID=1063 RepID=UPI000B780F22|nr:response regulator transcription factor [Cereibacter sphaeroides]
MKRIAIIDRYRLLRNLLSSYIAASLNADVDQFDGVDDFIATADAHGSFDVVLVDPYSSRTQGAVELERCVQISSGRPVVLFAREASSETVAEAQHIGAKGFIAKTMTPESVVHALQFVLCGEIFVPASFATEATPALSTASLTIREREVLKGVKMGMMNKEIATQLNVTEVTVKMHVRRLCLKLAVKNRTQLALVGSGIKLS